MTEGHTRRLAAILAADIAGYSALMSTDEEATVRALKAHQSVILPMIASHRGRVIDTAGDGILAEFASVLNAVSCAVGIQEVMLQRNSIMDPARRMQLRIGINQGDVISDGIRLFGDGVNIAARLEAIANPGGICLSSKVVDEIRDRLAIDYEDLGEQTLKNISSPIRAYRIRKKSPGEGETSHAANRIRSLPEQPSIAVLPFKNMSADADQEFFSDGIAEDILIELSKLRWLYVAARSSSFTFRGLAIDIKQVSKELGVRYVLEGSVRRSGNWLRVTAQLADATSGAQIWANRYDREISDLFVVQDELTHAVSKAIAPNIVDAEQKRAIRKATESLGAWEAYQRGVWHMAKHEATELITARSFFQQAIALNPNLAAAHSWTALTYTMAAAVFALMPVEEAVELAEPYARHAIALDGEDAEARTRLAIVLLLKGDALGVVFEAEQALLIDPHCSEGHALKGLGLLHLGRPGEGRECLRRCVELSPRSALVPMRLSQVAEAYYCETDYENAVRTAEMVIRQYPKNPLSYRWLAAALGQLGRQAEASAALQQLNRLNPASLKNAGKHHALRRAEYHEHMLEGLRKAGWTS